MTPDESDPEGLSMEFDAQELKAAGKMLGLAAKRALRAVASGATIEVEVGAGKPLRIVVRPRKRAD